VGSWQALAAQEEDAGHAELKKYTREDAAHAREYGFSSSRKEEDQLLHLPRRTVLGNALRGGE